MRWLLICSLALLPACQLFQQSDTIEEANAANGSGTVLHQSSEKPSESKLAEVIETELQEILDTGHRGINELPTERIETPIEQAIPNKQKESTLFQKVANLPKQGQKKRLYEERIVDRIETPTPELSPLIITERLKMIGISF